jgi:hypothetical protein
MDFRNYLKMLFLNSFFMYSFIRFSLFQVLILCILLTDISNFNKGLSFLHILSFFPAIYLLNLILLFFLLIFAIYQKFYLVLSFCLTLNCYCNGLSVCLSRLQSFFFICPLFFICFVVFFNIHHMFSLPVCLFVCLSVCLFFCLSACLFVCLSVCLFVCLFVCLSVCLFQYLFF